MGKLLHIEYHAKLLPNEPLNKIRWKLLINAPSDAFSLSLSLYIAESIRWRLALVRVTSRS